MKKLLFALAYRDLALIVAIALVFYQLDYLYTYTSDPVFYLKVGSLTAAAYLLSGILLSCIYLVLGLILKKLLLYKRQLIVFKIETSILLIVLIISPLLDNDPLIENVALPFMIAFVALSVFVLRILRDPLNKKARKQSLKIAVIILVAAILFNNAVIQAVAHLAYNAVPDISKMRFTITRIAPITGSGPPPRERHDSGKITHLAEGPDVFKIVLILLACTLFLILLILAVRRLMRYYRRIKDRLAFEKVITEGLYDENREFIKSGGNNSAAKGRRPRSQDYRTTVRACYAKFMRLCKEKSVEVKASDTTGQINEKYGVKYPAEAADALRSIYVRVRYSNETASKELAEQSMAEYRQIRQVASGAKGQGI